MARGGSPLDTDDPFPALELRVVDGGPMRLPGDLAGRWGVLLVYRAHW